MVVGAVVDGGIEELLGKEAVGRLDLDGVEAGRHGAFRGAPEGGDDALDLGRGHGPGYARGDHPGCPVGPPGQHLGVRRDLADPLRQGLAGLQRDVRDTADVDQLDGDVPAARVHGAGDRPPRVGLLVGEQALGPQVAASLG